jgi:hypothetical protein
MRELHKSCENPDGTDDQKKGSQLVDIYALEIQMCTATKNNKKLKLLYHKALDVKSAISPPRTMGMLPRKQWGKREATLVLKFRFRGYSRMWREDAHE